MALIVVLSVYNGIGTLTQSLFNIFDPELKIEATEGKTFHLDDIAYNDIISLPTVSYASPIVEENMWITYKERNKIATVRGVADNYAAMTGIDTMLHLGRFELTNSQSNQYIVMGLGVYYELGINSYDAHTPVGIHIPKRNAAIGGLSFERAFNSEYALTTGAFNIQDDFDRKYILANIDFVRQLMNYTYDEVSWIAINVLHPDDLSSTKAEIQRLLGKGYTVKDRFDQQPLYYKIFKSERMAIFLVAALIVLISTLNLISSLSLLIIDKRKDINTLKCMGANKHLIRTTFFTEGLLIALVGVLSGMAAGFAVCLLQQEFGIIKMGENFVVSSFPVAMRAVDFVAVFVLVSLLSLVAITYSVFRNKFE
jgi:lipoprotein-releasing system permease protein